MAMIGALRQQWHDLLRAWSVEPGRAEETFDDICKHYAEPGRRYHMVAHIRDVLEHVETLSPHARNLNAVKLAAWLHDVIYDSKASDNEERSAAYAERLCRRLAIPDGPVVASLILRTKSHEAGDDPDAQVLIDADLAILGAAESVYRTYAEQIRQEYAWVPEPEYCAGRESVLQRFLARAKLFHLLTELEEPARRNMTAEIGRVGRD
jgi:predicted metal-dependent HD superfamily phosphohydrolase